MYGDVPNSEGFHADNPKIVHHILGLNYPAKGRGV
jgi:hypothetical protein